MSRYLDFEAAAVDLNILKQRVKEDPYPNQLGCGMRQGPKQGPIQKHKHALSHQGQTAKRKVQLHCCLKDTQEQMGEGN